MDFTAAEGDSTLTAVNTTGDSVVTSKPLPAMRMADQFSSNIHPWMKGCVWAFDHPYFAVTDANGGFVIPNAPAGKWRLVVARRGGVRRGGAARNGADRTGTGRVPRRGPTPVRRCEVPRRLAPAAQMTPSPAGTRRTPVPAGRRTSGCWINTERVPPSRRRLGAMVQAYDPAVTRADVALER